ncbi:MAG TPA: transglycosylase domain-containing protein, partial [Myxococcales bacterium]|nr:transglycosylase domain-containing protein [Myxococcales bacterium]
MLLALDALRLEGTRSREQALADLGALPGRTARALGRSLVGLLHAIARSGAVRWTVLTLEHSADAAHRMPLRWKVAVYTLALTPLVVSFELRSGFLEAHLFSALASRLQWTVGQGPSPSIVYPQSGPFDEERGYSRIPEFVRNLSRRGYRIGEQARFSGTLAMLARAGLTPPWREPPTDGLVIRDASGDTLFRGSSRRDLLTSYDELPPLVVSTLLYIENRGLISDPEPTSNPAVDWARFAKASGLWAGRRIGLPLPVEGGSTLAVQLEKLRHFSGGRTRSPADKLRQIAAASLRAYRLGPDTRSARREIILGYLNSAPLAATPSHGEVNGLGEGLRYWFDRDPHRTLLTIARPGSIERQARAYRAVLALVCALRAPTEYLIEDRPALEKRMAFYTDRLEESGVLPRELAAAVRNAPLALEPDQRTRTPHWFRSDKSTDAVRGEVAQLLGV